MSTIQIKAKVIKGSSCNAAVKIGGQTVSFNGSGTKNVSLEPQLYIAVVVGFPDPGSPGSSIVIQFIQDGKMLNEVTITEENPIQHARVMVS
jgi:hypothetical protein